jgi:hypothetical protein
VYRGHSTGLWDKKSKVELALHKKKFWSLNFILSDDGFHKTAAKKEELESCLLLTLLYAVHMWSQSSTDKKIIQVSQRKMEIKSLWVTMKDKAQNTTVR